MKSLPALSLRLICSMFALLGSQATGFNYEGHRLINQLALKRLPEGFPKFVREPEAAERIAFLAGEPDRLRNTGDNTLKHYNKPEHYFDVEYLEPLGIELESLPPFRYDFAIRIGEARRVRGNNHPSVDDARNPDRTKQQIGFLPWSIAEQFSKLKSAFSYLKAYEENGTLDEIANARRNVIQYMGVLGHFVGDAAQPLHTTKHFNGWVGDNPKNYTTSRGFHSWIDGGYLGKVGVDVLELSDGIRDARVLRNEAEALARSGVFEESLNYVLEQHALVEPLYQMDKEGKLTPGSPLGLEGQEFFEQQFTKASQMLGDLWYTAWKEAPTDNYLKSYLARRKLRTDGNGS